jgi:hypothetical protein
MSVEKVQHGGHVRIWVETEKDLKVLENVKALGYEVVYLADEGCYYFTF